MPPRLRIAAGIALAIAAAGIGLREGGSRAVEPAAATSSGADHAEGAEAGFVVWESNRSGTFRIWRQDLAGGEAHPISPAEPGRDHCCAKLSPNGSRLVYLSLPGGARRYGPQAGALHLVDADGERNRVLVGSARHYGEHRAAVWWGEDELVYLDGRNATVRRKLSTGEEAELVPPAAGDEGWLVAPGGRIATGNTPTFADLVPGDGVRPRPSLGGCQPAFSGDGRLAVWSAGAGGPIDALDLATRRSWTILEKGDTHLPAGRGYLYFPMLSQDRSLLAVGASPGEHDHFRADYDIFVLELDPATLLPAAAAQAVAPDPAVDRFPDLYRSPRAGAPAAATVPPSTPAVPASSDAASSRGLAFLWRSADADNRFATGGASEILQPAGAAWIDRFGALALGGGSFAATAATGERLAATLQAKHQLTLALLLTPASLDQQGALVAFSDGPRGRNFVVRQEGERLRLDLRTSDSSKEGMSVVLARLTSTAPTQLLLTFSPGRLDAFVDGERSGEARETLALPGDLFPWRPRALTFGAEPGSAGSWRGTLSNIAIWNRPLAGAEIAAEAARLRQLLAQRGESRRITVEMLLRASSPVPSLDEISPYREALVVDEFEVVRPLASPPTATPASGTPAAGERIRVVRWAILDGQTLAAPTLGATVRRVLEPFAAQPQLESYFLADRLPPQTGGALYFDLGATAAP